MTMIEHPRRMTVEEADTQFYPNSYIMVHCELDEGVVFAGQVVAFMPLKQQGELIDYADELLLSGRFGEVRKLNTKDPLDGGALLVEYSKVEQE